MKPKRGRNSPFQGGNNSPKHPKASCLSITPQRTQERRRLVRRGKRKQGRFKQKENGLVYVARVGETKPGNNQP